MQIEEFVEKLEQEFPNILIVYKKDFKWFTIKVCYNTIENDVYIVTERQLRNEKISNRRIRDIAYLIRERLNKSKENSQFWRG